MGRKRKPFFQTAVGSVLKGVAGVVAPGLVGALDGVGSLREAIQVIDDSTEPAEIKVKLRELALEQERIELEAFEAEVDDRNSAREREIELAKVGGDNRLQWVIGWGATIIFAVMIAALVFLDIPEEKQRLFDIALSYVSGVFTLICSYFFGSAMRK